MVKQILAWIVLMIVFLFASVDWEPQVEYVQPVETETVVYVAETEPVVVRESEELIFEEYHITGYCICEKCCGKTDGIGAAGVLVEPGITIASGRDIPFGTEIWIEGIGIRTVQDRGSAIGSGEIDILFKSHEEALDFGSKYLKVRILP